MTEQERQRRIAEQTGYLRCCWGKRNAGRGNARPTYRHYTRQAVGELRYLTGRPRKAFGPSHYGHPSML